MRHNVTTPGGFFVGLGGIVAFCVVSSLVYLAVKAPTRNEALRPQQAALGLVAAPDALPPDVKKKKEETDALLKAAGQRYNDGKEPDINRLADLRGVLRYREAQKSLTTGTATLNAPSSVEGKTVIAAAMDEVVREMQAKKPAPSKIALAETAPADPKAAPALPNYTGGGVRTMTFVDPTKPAAAPVPAAAPAPTTPAAPTSPAAPVPVP